MDKEIKPIVFLLLSLAVVSVTQWAAVPRLFSDDNHPIPDPGSLTAWEWVGNLSLTESWRFHLTARCSSDEGRPRRPWSSRRRSAHR